MIYLYRRSTVPNISSLSDTDVTVRRRAFLVSDPGNAESGGGWGGVDWLYSMVENLIRNLLLKVLSERESTPVRVKCCVMPLIHVVGDPTIATLGV